MRIVALVLIAIVGSGQTTLAPFHGARSGAGLPAGAIGVWYADQGKTSPRRYIPNSAVPSDPAPTSVISGGRSLFNTATWTQAAVTVADYAAVGPDGLSEASTVIGSTSGWALTRTAPLLAGTYTCAISVKSNTGSNQGFKLQCLGLTSAVLTATTSWQRFSLSATVSTGNAGMGLQNDGTTAASLQICDFNMFSGSSDLGAEGQNSAMSIGKGGNDTTGSVSGGILDLSAASSFGIANLNSSYTFSSGVTVVGIARKVNTNSSIASMLTASRGSFTNLSAYLEYNNLPQVAYNGDETFSGRNTAEWAWNGLGWHSFGFRYDLANRSLWLDNGKFLTKAVSVSAITVQNLIMGTINQGTSYGQGWQYAAVALYNRSLSDTEMRTAQSALFRHSGFARGTLRVLISEGDSITQVAPTYATMFYANQSPANIGSMYATNGATLANLISRAAALDAIIPPVGSRPTGAKYILSVLIGANDLNGYTGATDTIAANNYATDVAAYLDARRAAGWTVALGTLTPRTVSGAPNFNNRRAIYNPIIRGWVGTHCDAIFDFGADATMGPDAAASNTTYYGDGLHPTSAGHTILETIYRPVINGL